MPTTLPPSRPESTSLAMPPVMPHWTTACRRALGRYLRARWGDLWGSLHPVPSVGRWMDWLDAMTTGRSRPGSSTPAPTWDAAVARQRWPAERFRQRYEADAVPARMLFFGAILSVLIAAYHVGCSHLPRALTSLSMAFVLASIALAPAYRCWRLRTRGVGSAQTFLRHPRTWWPDPLPPDQQP